MTAPPTDPNDEQLDGVTRSVSRRSFVRTAAVVSGSIALPGWLAACSSSSDEPTTPTTADTASPPTTTGEVVPAPPSSTEPTDPTETPAAGTDASADGEPTALQPLTPGDFAAVTTSAATRSQPAGPFHLDEELRRRDITEDRDGMPLRVGIRVVDDVCMAVVGAQVEVWHADAFGDYSAFVDGSVERGEAGPGSTFLRGSQLSDADGIVEFHTIWPGWYPGRAVHIHFIVTLDSGRSFTSQMYFPDDVNEEIYSAPPYTDRAGTSQRNRDDAIAGDLTGSGLVAEAIRGPTAAGPGWRALLQVVVS